MFRTLPSSRVRTPILFDSTLFGRALFGRFRFAPCALLILGFLAATLATSVASASVVFDTRADVNWAAAPGTVVDYGVWVLPAGAAPPSSTASPTFRVATTATTVTGQYGEGVQILVAAFYGGGLVGPFSAPSDAIYFRAPLPAPYDFNGDGRADRILYDDRSARLRISLVDGAAAVPSVDLIADNARRLNVSGSADFDGDGNADLVMWEHSTGAAELWLMNGDQVRAKLPIATLGAGWYARALGDIDADGTARLLWHNATTGESQLWSMRNEQVTGQLPLLSMSKNWEVWGNCDVDGNGVRDLVWIDQKAKAARLWLLDAAGSADEVAMVHPGGKWWFESCGDFDGNGAQELVWQTSKKVRLWSFSHIDPGTASAIGVERSLTKPARTWIQQVGDFDGDGDPDLALVPKSRDAILTLLLEADATIAQGSSPVGVEGRWSISSW